VAAVAAPPTTAKVCASELSRVPAHRLFLFRVARSRAVAAREQVSARMYISCHGSAIFLPGGQLWVCLLSLLC